MKTVNCQHLEPDDSAAKTVDILMKRNGEKFSPMKVRFCQECVDSNRHLLVAVYPKPVSIE